MEFLATGLVRQLDATKSPMDLKYRLTDGFTGRPCRIWVLTVRGVHRVSASFAIEKRRSPSLEPCLCASSGELAVEEFRKSWS
jgi:hypothetical protein